MTLDLAAQRLVVLQELTAALARTRTYDEIAAVIIDGGSRRPTGHSHGAAAASASLS